MRMSVSLCARQVSKTLAEANVKPKSLDVSVHTSPISYRPLSRSKLQSNERIALQEFNKMIVASRHYKQAIIKNAISAALKASKIVPETSQLESYKSNLIKAQAELKKIQKSKHLPQLPVVSAALSPQNQPNPKERDIQRSLRRQAQEAQATIAFQKLVEEISMTRKAHIENILNKLTEDANNRTSHMSTKPIIEAEKVDELLKSDPPKARIVANKDKRNKMTNANKVSSDDASQDDIEGKAELDTKPLKSPVRRSVKSNRERDNTLRHASPPKPIDYNMKDDYNDRERATYFNLLKQQVGERLSNAMPSGAAMNNPEAFASMKPSPLGFPGNPTGLFRL